MSIALLLLGLAIALFARNKTRGIPNAPLQLKLSDFYVSSKGAFVLRPEIWASAIAQQLAVRTAQAGAIYPDPDTGADLRPCVLVSVPGPNALQWVADEVQRRRTVLVMPRITSMLISVPSTDAVRLTKNKDFGVIASPEGLAED